MWDKLYEVICIFSNDREVDRTWGRLQGDHSDFALDYLL